jgi:hypothetical protein
VPGLWEHSHQAVDGRCSACNEHRNALPDCQPHMREDYRTVSELWAETLFLVDEQNYTLGQSTLSIQWGAKTSCHVSYVASSSPWSAQLRRVALRAPRASCMRRVRPTEKLCAGSKLTEWSQPPRAWPIMLFWRLSGQPAKTWGAGNRLNRNPTNAEMETMLGWSVE